MTLTRLVDSVVKPHSHVIESYKRRRHPRSDASLSKNVRGNSTSEISLSFVTQRRRKRTLFCIALVMTYNKQTHYPLTPKKTIQEKKEVFSPNGSLTFVFFPNLILLKNVFSFFQVHSRSPSPTYRDPKKTSTAWDTTAS